MIRTMSQIPIKLSGYGPTVSRRPLRHLWDLRLMNFLLMAATLALLIGYLGLNNRAATNGFRIRALESRLTELENQGRRLEIERLSRQSMESVKRQVESLGFVPVGNVEYVVAAGGAVAVK